ncbi:MAG: hypothetical protein CYPHOPRED_005034 [Cyphobasidiales sp. Tagirdzhanova-0007]|nr:MAG: hypothetical protein CYPHOPRED_005034 [Cyphobasidiales sp. Tagirdzhanova-0007]
MTAKLLDSFNMPSHPVFLRKLGLRPASTSSGGLPSTLSTPHSFSSLFDVTHTEAVLQSPLPIYVPPLNFAIVTPSIYRSGFPRPENFPFLDSLELNTILYIADQNFKEDTLAWANKRGLKVLHIR